MTTATSDSDIQTEELESDVITDDDSQTETDDTLETEEDTKVEEDHAAKLEKARNEVKMWKGRAKKAQEDQTLVEEATDEPVTEKVMKESQAQLEWRLRNESRISLVREEYDQILEDGFEGQTVTAPIALELAEKQNKVDNVAERNRQSDMSVESVTSREATDDFEPTNDEKRDGITKEMKKKHAKSVELMRNLRG